VSGVADWDTWWDGASDEERAEFLDDSLDLPDAEPFRRTCNVCVLPWWAAAVGARERRRKPAPTAI
jgi:hypothetical protein